MLRKRATGSGHNLDDIILTAQCSVAVRPVRGSGGRKQYGNTTPPCDTQTLTGVVPRWHTDCNAGIPASQAPLRESASVQ